MVVDSQREFTVIVWHIGAIPTVFFHIINVGMRLCLSHSPPHGSPPEAYPSRTAVQLLAALGCY